MVDQTAINKGTVYVSDVMLSFTSFISNLSMVHWGIIILFIIMVLFFIKLLDYHKKLKSGRYGFGRR